MFKICLTTVLLVTTSIAQAQSSAHDSSRWEPNIRKFEERLQSGETKPGGILFIGSSSIVRWDLDQWLPDRKTVNHGFGGSQLADSVNFFDRAVLPVKPHTIVLYAGDNDIAQGKTPAQVTADFQEFVDRVRTDLPPETRVLYIAVKPSIKRWSLREPMSETNQKIQALCEADDQLEFVDVWNPMLGADGTPEQKLFAEDNLHLSEQGYQLWTKILNQKL